MLPIQCKLARVALGVKLKEMAEMVQTSPDTLSRLERGETLRPSTLAAIRASLEAAGVVFIEADEELGPGVRLRDREAR